MASENNKGLVGVCFSDKKVKLVEVEFSGGQYQINRIMQLDANLPKNFFSGLDLNESSISQMSAILNQTIDKAGLKLSKTVLTLDSRMVMVKKVPVDSDLPEQEMKNQINWEAEQYVPHSADDYIIDYNQLKGADEKPFNELLLVMVRRAVVDFWLRVFKNTQLELSIVDVDLFAAIRAIKSNYEYQKNEKIGLVDIGKEKVKITLMIEGDYFFSSEFDFHSTDRSVSSPEPDVDDLSRLISKELRRIILDNKLGTYVDDLDRIFLYGEKVSEDLVEGLQNAYNVRINKVNPFRKVRFLSSEVGGNFVRNSPETFVVCVGAALRKN